jgi:hypothetical protein
MCRVEFLCLCAAWKFGVYVLRGILVFMCCVEFWGLCAAWNFGVYVLPEILVLVSCVEFWCLCAAWNFGVYVVRGILVFMCCMELQFLDSLPFIKYSETGSNIDFGPYSDNTGPIIVLY